MHIFKHFVTITITIQNLLSKINIISQFFNDVILETQVYTFVGIKTVAEIKIGTQRILSLTSLSRKRLVPIGQDHMQLPYP